MVSKKCSPVFRFSIFEIDINNKNYHNERRPKTIPNESQAASRGPQEGHQMHPQEVPQMAHIVSKWHPEAILADRPSQS